MLKTANRRHFRVAALFAACSLLAGYLAVEAAELRHERNMLLVKLATMMAHGSIDSDEHNVVGNVDVTSVGGTQYRATGKVIMDSKMCDWGFTFFNDEDVPTVPVDIHIRAAGSPLVPESSETISEVN
jgi:hypothetical protein